MSDRPTTIAFWRGRLPHWEVADGHYFVTMHLAGAIPEEATERIRAIGETLAQESEDEYLRVQRRIFLEMEAWLDRSEVVAHLVKPSIVTMVKEAIVQREKRGVWRVFEYVIMPNHLHLYLRMTNGRLKGALEQFRRWTGHEAAKLVNTDGNRFWQREWFDHWARSPWHGERIKAYIRNNPVKAGLVANHGAWPHGSWPTES